MLLKNADIVLTARAGVLGQLIRELERGPFEEKSIVEHCGIITKPGTVAQAKITECLARGTVERNVLVYCGPDVSGAIYRRKNLTPALANIITIKALNYVGRHYGYLKLLCHAADYFLGGRYVFRKLCRMDNYPICSWLVAHSFAAAGIWFDGVDADYVQPDDIWDEVQGDEWECVGVL